jgi:hypothetical protein
MACDDQRACSSIVQLSVEQPERETPEVITVKVADDDRVDGGRIDLCGFEPNQARRSAIDQTAPVAVLDEDAPLQWWRRSPRTSSVLPPTRSKRRAWRPECRSRQLECWWQCEQLPHKIPELVVDDQQLRNDTAGRCSNSDGREGVRTSLLHDAPCQRTTSPDQIDGDALASTRSPRDRWLLVVAGAAGG